MYSNDFILKSSIVEQILRKRRATPLITPFLEDFDGFCENLESNNERTASIPLSLSMLGNINDIERN